MTALLWRFTGPPHASRHAELQRLSWPVRVVWLAALAAAVGLSPWPLPSAAAVVAACWTAHGWQRRWIRVDDHHVRVGQHAFARADVVHAEAHGTRVLRELRRHTGLVSGIVFRRYGLPGYCVVAGIRWVVEVATQTPEGVCDIAFISSRRPAELIAALTLDPPPDETRGLRAFLPAPAPSVRDDVHLRYRGRVSATGAHWGRVVAAGLVTAVVVGLASGLWVLAVVAAGVVVLAAARTTIARSRQPVTVEGGLLCVGDHRLLLASLRSLRPVTVPELGSLAAGMRLLDVAAYAEAVAAVPPWATEGVVLTFFTPGSPPWSEVPAGRLPPDEETTAVAVVAADDTQRLVTALLDARHALVGPS